GHEPSTASAPGDTLPVKGVRQHPVARRAGHIRTPISGIVHPLEPVPPRSTFPAPLRPSRPGRRFSHVTGSHLPSPTPPPPRCRTPKTLWLGPFPATPSTRVLPGLSPSIGIKNHVPVTLRPHGKTWGDPPEEPLDDPPTTPSRLPGRPRRHQPAH